MRSPRGEAGAMCIILDMHWPAVARAESSFKTARHEIVYFCKTLQILKHGEETDSAGSEFQWGVRVPYVCSMTGVSMDVPQGKREYEAGRGKKRRESGHRQSKENGKCSGDDSRERMAEETRRAKGNKNTQ